MTDDDIQELFSLLKQMTECILSKNNNNLITALKKFVKKTKNSSFRNFNHIRSLSKLISSADEDLTIIINKLNKLKM